MSMEREHSRKFINEMATIGICEELITNQTNSQSTTERMGDLIWKCIFDVTEELKGIIPYKNFIQWKICDSTSYLGKYSFMTNTISITKYLVNKQDIRNTIAHELIHACGIHGHQDDFKDYAEKLKLYGFDVMAEINDNSLIDKARENRKQYVVKCTHCNFEVKRARQMRIEKYRCPYCKNKLTIERM